MIDRQRTAWLHVLAVVLSAQNGSDDTPDEGANEAQARTFLTALNGGVPLQKGG